MKREFLFRVYCSEEKSYFGGDFINGTKYAIFPLFYDEYCLEDTDIIEQYTGLNDKYDNKIFEGDIIRVESYIDREEFTVYEVYWDNDFLNFGLKCLNGVNYDTALGDISPSSCAVIGNIHSWF